MSYREPCPFCASINLVLLENTSKFIWCKDCNTMGPDGKTIEEAEEKWNKARREDK